MKHFILLLEQKKLFTERIAFARLLLAISALLTLLFNDIKYITNFNLLLTNENTFTTIIFFKQYSIFSLWPPLVAKSISIIILLTVLTGYIPQLTCFFHTWVHLSICNSFLGVDGGDQIASNLSLLLIPLCLFDNRINQWKNSKERKTINVFFNVYYLLILLQVAIIYLHAGMGKLYNIEWRNGTCVYYWFTNNVFGAPLYLQKIYNTITLSDLSPIITWMVIILELGLFACILATSQKIKRFFLILGLLFHFNIIFVHGLVTFFFSMAAALILYLDDENIVYQFIKIKIISLKNAIQSRTYRRRKKQLAE
ncbi:sporulation-delaying protein SdpB family protein [Flavobacterium sp.]|uniref:sporulation-delaying protein SdpB family protein n=1 Tax=Flavobacterium sp. TaxID=239 RepID=UPI0031DD3D62